MAAVAFNDHPDACRWINQAMTDINYYMFLFQATSDGAFAEGPNYYVYAMANTHPFFVSIIVTSRDKAPYRNIYNNK